MILPPQEPTIPSIPTAEVVLMAAKRNVISKKSSESDLSGRIQSTGASFAVGSLPNEPNIDIAGEAWAARHNAEIWGNENRFRDQADGFFD
jgi:hypothetical protein